jgi:hypothetical protein
LGVFLQNYKKSRISYDYRFIFLKKNLRLIWVVQTEIYGLDLKKTKGYFHSNLDRPSKIRWLGSFPSTSARSAKQNHRGTMIAGFRGPKLELRCTICDEVSSYVIYTMRGIQFAHLPRWKRQRESRR